MEVICKRSGKIRRFAFGTEVGFAVNLINKKLEGEDGLGFPLASHIEAVKEGEIPVSFGPNSVLVDYGPGWKLQTVYDTGVAYSFIFFNWHNHYDCWLLLISGDFELYAFSS